MLSIACLEVKDVVPWVSALILCVSIRIAFMMKRTQGMLSSKEKSIQVIDANLGCLWGDMVRLCSAFSNDPRRTMADVLVAYKILVANPIATESLRLRHIRSESSRIFMWSVE